MSHNIYVSHVARLEMSYSWSSRSHIGHLVKSRAAETVLFYNRFSTDGGAGSHEVDLPNGGLGILVGNSVTQGRETDNASLIAYGEEGDVQPGGLNVVGNTLVDESGTGGRAVYLGYDVDAHVEVRNNVVVDFTTVADPGAVLAGNCVTTATGPGRAAAADRLLGTLAGGRADTHAHAGRDAQHRDPGAGARHIPAGVARHPAAAASIGWEWGGDWQSLKDYQHFSQEGT